MKPNLLPNREAIQSAYQQGEEAVLALFEIQAKIIRDLEKRLQALEDQIVKNRWNFHLTIRYLSNDVLR